MGGRPRCGGTWNSSHLEYRFKDANGEEDVISYPVPMTKIAGLNPKLARMIANVVYVGVMAELLGMNQDVLEAA